MREHRRHGVREVGARSGESRFDDLLELVDRVGLEIGPYHAWGCGVRKRWVLGKGGLTQSTPHTTGYHALGKVHSVRHCEGHKLRTC